MVIAVWTRICTCQLLEGRARARIGLHVLESTPLDRLYIHVRAVGAVARVWPRVTEQKLLERAQGGGCVCTRVYADTDSLVCKCLISFTPNWMHSASFSCNLHARLVTLSSSNIFIFSLHETICSCCGVHSPRVDCTVFSMHRVSLHVDIMRPMSRRGSTTPSNKDAHTYTLRCWNT